MLTEAAYRAFLADPSARVATYRGAEDAVQGTKSPADWWPSQHAEFTSEIKRRNDADAAAKKAAEVAREQAKSDFISRWIAEHADDAIRAQFADGLLCRNTALGMIADAAFAAAGVPEKATYRDDFCDATSCPCGTKELDCLPRSVYPAWKQIKAGLPEGYMVEFSRVRECLKHDDDGYPDPDSETAGPAMYLATIKMPHGPFTFERTAKLG